MSQCTYRCVVPPDTTIPEVTLQKVVCLNAPTGAWCPLTRTLEDGSFSRRESQCTYRCVVPPDIRAGVCPPRVPPRLNAPTGAWCPLTSMSCTTVRGLRCLNAPTGAWCPLTVRGNCRHVVRHWSQCTYRCVVPPDLTYYVDWAWDDESQCTYRCVVPPDPQGVGKVGGGWSDVRGCRRVGAGAARPGR